APYLSILIYNIFLVLLFLIISVSSLIISVSRYIYKKCCQSLNPLTPNTGPMCHPHYTDVVIQHCC
uniref:Uncharacterized protein n=1 Tax=Ciona intestinalis TaxID=7719 RepID=H2Y029_CIOIN